MRDKLDKMKVLIVQNTDWLKRNPGQQHHLAEMLSTRGHEIRVIDFEITWRTQGRREFHSKREIFRNVSKIHPDAKITVIRPSIMKVPVLDYISMMLSHWKEISRQIREFTPDVVLSFGIVAYMAGRAAKKNRIPFVYYWIDVSHRLIPFKPLRPVGLLIEQRALKLAAEVLAINDTLKEYVIRIGAPREKTRVLTAGIDFEHFDLRISKEKVRKQHGFSQDDIILFFMGWLYQFSGLKEVAIELAKLQNKHVKLLIVGEGDALNELQQIRSKLNMQDQLILVGRRPYSEIPTFIAAADICLLPAYSTESIMRDIVPIKTYEYMAMKKPVIASKLPGVMKEFGTSNGLVYIDRPEDAVKKALELIERGGIEELGRKARNFAERYSWVNIADEFDQILRETINQNKSQIQALFTEKRSRNRASRDRNA
jgi:glycosyltransferase involved in cell wall biosynthesis